MILKKNNPFSVPWQEYVFNHNYANAAAVATWSALKMLSRGDQESARMYLHLGQNLAEAQKRQDNSGIMHQDIYSEFDEQTQARIATSHPCLMR